jgi:MFS family permease
LSPQPPLLAIYSALLVGSAARAYELPALHATLASLVPRTLLGRAVSAYSSSGKLSQLIGPALGGVMYSVGGGSLAFGCAFALFSGAFLGALTLPRHHTPVLNDEKGWRSAFAGLRFILTTKPLLGVMILDLVATLFGGVAAVLPIFARDILDIGPFGLGLLRSAPALGGFTLAVIMARRALPFGMAATMFGGLLFYGTMTIAFGLSTNAVLSFIVLLGVGMGDMLSGVVRQTAMQLWTPDDKRGRVLAVSTMSGQSANQLGTIEAGIAAELLGASGSVVFGGLAVYAAVALCYWTFPAIRRVDAPLKV